SNLVKMDGETYGQATKALQTAVTLLHKAEANQSIAPTCGIAADAAQRTVSLIERITVNVESDSLRGGKKKNHGPEGPW
ncbi:hypothetical protein, partial [Streptococcus pneumoniae]|uniref:hypothetical protein n=1 Tax=Streptococcus pneumoniae TaxID=1313 RepID=UPI001953BE7F